MKNRDIDKLIAEKVFNWELMKDTSMVKAGFLTYRRMSRTLVMDWQEAIVPEFSIDISAAWQVIEWLEVRGIVSVSNADDNGKGCVFIPYVFRGRGLKSVSASASCYPRAICLVALRAVGVEEWI